MAEWYYSKNRQRLGPVPETELKRLAEQGELRPADLVWTADMDDWAEAVTLPRFFPGSTGPDAGERTGRRRSWEDDDIDIRYDDAPRRRRKSSSGLVIAMSIFGGILLLGAAVVLLVAVLDNRPPPAKRPGPQQGAFFAPNPRFIDHNLPAAKINSTAVVPTPLDGPTAVNGTLVEADADDVRMWGCRCKVYTLQMTAGEIYDFRLESRDFDCFLRIEDENGVQLAENDDIDPGIDNNSFISFQVQRTAQHRIVVSTWDPGQLGAYVLKIDRKKTAPEPKKKAPPKR